MGNVVQCSTPRYIRTMYVFVCAREQEENSTVSPEKVREEREAIM